MAALIGGDTPQAVISKPTTVPSAPSRSASEVDSLAEKQRKQFSAASSFTKNYFTGGNNDPVSTTTRTLGGGV